MAASRIDLTSGSKPARAQRRRQAWGDLADRVLVDPLQHYPRFQPLPTLLRTANTNVYCNPSTAAPLDPNLETKLKQLRIPDNQKCLASTALEAQALLDTHSQQDRRYSASLDQLNRTQRAKKHLDRARQLYSVGLAWMKKGVDTLRVAEQLPGDNPARTLTERQGHGYLHRAQALVYNTVPGQPQTPKPGKKSALSELYDAYRLIRDYEMNPLAPLTATGHPNTLRVAEDTTYAQLMGSDRLEPNRLGLGPWARAVWDSHGLRDPNYYTAGTEHTDPNDPQGRPDQQRLYCNVSSASVRGPQQWVAWQDAMQHKFGQATPVAVRPLSVATLQAAGFDPRRLSSDSSRALLDVHQHFQPAAPQLLDPTQGLDGWQGVAMRADAWLPLVPPQGAVTQVPRATTQPPPDLRSAPYAVPGQTIDGRPSLFYPTALRGTQVNPQPVLGVPDTSLGYWDARVSCHLLGSHSAHLLQALQHCQEQQQMQRIAAHPQTVPTLQPLMMWPAGPTLPDATTPTRQSAPWPGDNVNPLRRNATLVREPVAWNPVQPASLQMGSMPQNIAAGDGEPLRWRGANYRYGTPDAARPRRGRPDVVSAVPHAAYLNMLQHALYLLGAPSTRWQRERLPRHLWTERALQYQRQSDGTWRTPSQPGWLVLKDPAAEHGTVLGNLGYPRQRSTSSASQQDERKHLVESDQPVGPFSLDEAFGDVGHQPAPDYHPEHETRNPAIHHHVWVVRTNQQFAYGHNTLGLDFY